MANIVAIVGRPNVGKSTLFNRLIEQRKAIMDNQSGVTRDRHYGFADWTEHFFTVIDTGGYVVGSEDIFEGAIRDQVQIAMEEASVLLFMVDTMTGLTDLDKEFANVVRKSKKPVLVVANKAESVDRFQSAAEFYELGLGGEIYPISSQTGEGTGDLLDAVVKYFQSDGQEDPEAGIPKISILGRPNVGKSSYLNMLTGKERSIVTNIAGTTRDSINTRYKAFGKDFILIDTAGLRRKAKISDAIEFYSTLRTIKAMEESDVVIVMLDASKGLEAQDMTIIGMADKAKKGIVVMMNKWDLVEKDSKTADTTKKEMLERLAPMDYMPIIFASVQDKQRIFQVMEKAMEVYENKTRKISTSKLNDVMLGEIAKYPPPAHRGRYIKIKYMIQLPTPSPTFVFFCNNPKYLQESYRRYLENRMRENFGFEGVPITLFFREK
ncbi:MAG: ribosome biogenesis GTPase Der [Runella slithyformis]|jgi:GTPase|nr:MAG: ribosome biogenesis GTPase Der [Runella slithyformis]TAG24328.1 MAG: ribosome biogenesis GTPase Der [Cytophagales bacterium]TAG35143.1 MAG: ribosome biogenesis GTPase Der [Cytophagia bacterium]TAE93388.1 MAG: ribosome biogenesis GTPase Der [Runella slithyformis]TAF23485.1 MAG: ribosome biogenesis GTPase Der [Runella slithyformis]